MYRPTPSAFSRLLVAASVGILSTACGIRNGSGSPGAHDPSERKGPKIVLTESIVEKGGYDTVRFGRLHSGEIAVRRIWIENAATRPVAIASYARSCGCTTLDFDARPIAPGEAQRIALAFDSHGEWGWQLKTLDIALAGAAAPLRLFIEAEVE